MIYSPDGERPAGLPDDPTLITKIVIGSLSKDSGIDHSSLSWLDFADYPQLRALYLWNITGLTELAELPASLEWLDVQKCPDLVTLPMVSSVALESLVLIDLPRLEAVPVPIERKQALREIILRGCPMLKNHTFHDWLAVAGDRLTHFDGSGNDRVTGIKQWPDSLVDIRLNGCRSLELIPAYPPGLRRFEVAGTRIARLPDFPESIDYISLASMRELTVLPDFQQARTLFLHGSAILSPPASQHGSSPSENVAQKTRSYREDLAIFGEGEVKRCKIMVLGNGRAGKSCLSLNLSGGNPHRTAVDYQPVDDAPENAKVDTTHGVIFYEMDRQVPVESQYQRVNLHLWDFGGQDIYHNTHRIFLSTGTIFVVVWDPDQDGKQPLEEGDVWRPLSYWIDYIETACQPIKPSIAVVCSGARQESHEDLLQRLAAQLGDGCDRVSHFFVDSLAATPSPDQGPLLDWVDERAGRIIASQGTRVPSHWDIAQEMVEAWVRRLEQDSDFAEQRQQISFQEFGQELLQTCRAAVQQWPGDEPPPLARVLDGEPGQPFRFSEDQIERTLDFLSHAGWVYWNRSLYDQRVIIGQKWAMEGIYTLLERPASHPDSRVHYELADSRGRFTLEDLKKWGWGKIYTEDEQKLLLTFLQDVGLCFSLDRHHWWRDEVREYISLNHLRTAPMDRWQSDFESFGEDASLRQETLSLQPFHQGQFDLLLIAFGQQFGKTGFYARDGFYLKNQQGQAAIVTAEFRRDFLAGEILVQSRGAEVDEFHRAMVSYITDSAHGLSAGEKKVAPPTDAGTPEPSEVEVFISYTWNPWDSEGDCSYEEPVDYIYEALSQHPQIKPLRDNMEIQQKGSINDFMGRISETSYVIIVYSDKYFRSPYCMWEFMAVIDSYSRTSLNYIDNLILVEHESSQIQTFEGSDAVMAEWRAKTGSDFHVRMKSLDPPVRSVDTFKMQAISFIDTKIPEIFDGISMVKPWDPEKGDEIVAWIEESLGFGEEKGGVV